MKGDNKKKTLMVALIAFTQFNILGCNSAMIKMVSETAKFIHKSGIQKNAGEILKVARETSEIVNNTGMQEIVGETLNKSAEQITRNDSEADLMQVVQNVDKIQDANKINKPSMESDNAVENVGMERENEEKRLTISAKVTSVDINSNVIRLDAGKGEDIEKGQSFYVVNNTTTENVNGKTTNIIAELRVLEVDKMAVMATCISGKCQEIKENDDAFSHVE
jgi:hypothetical protein